MKEDDLYPEEPRKSKLPSILREIEALAPRQGKHIFIEGRARHAFEAATKLMALITDAYPEDEAADLEKRFVNAVRSRDYRKFKRGIDRMVEGKAETI